MQMKGYLTTALMPPFGACRSSCAAPVTVFWLFGIVSVTYGFLGGPTGTAGISWYTVALGTAMWGIAAVWAMLTMQGVEADRCDRALRPRARHVPPNDAESDPFDHIKKAH